MFRIRPQKGYALLTPAEKDVAEFQAKMSDGIHLYETGTGISLSSRWNDAWEFVENKDFASKYGVGDFAEMNKLLATHAKGYEFLKPLVGDAAEILRGKFNGKDLWLFNITRHVDRNKVVELDDMAIFRVNPVGLDILCGPAFKEAFERGGFTGLEFREVLETDNVQMV